MEDTSEATISWDEAIEKIIELSNAQNFPDDVLAAVDDLRRKHLKVRRDLRDSIFTHLFRRKEYVLELYKTLHPEDTEVTLADIRIITIENVLASGIHNDLGFSVRDQLFVLVEAQTKWSQNIVLRELQYLVDTWDRYL